MTDETMQTIKNMMPFQMIELDEKCSQCNKNNIPGKLINGESHYLDSLINTYERNHDGSYQYVKVPLKRCGQCLIKNEEKELKKQVDTWSNIWGRKGQIK